MTEQDKPAFGTLMMACGELCNRQLSSVVLDMQFLLLADLALEDIQRALTAHFQSHTFFPMPAEIREAIQGSPEDRAEVAWTDVRRLVRSHGWVRRPQAHEWPDAATERAAMELYGGWVALCENLPVGGPEMLGTAKLFKASYAAYARRDDREAVLTPSRDEARERLHGLKAELQARNLPTGDL